MKKYLAIIFGVCFFSTNYAFTQLRSNSISLDTIQEKEISFIIQDKPTALLTMRQSNENSLSIYRLAINGLNKSFSSKKLILLNNCLIIEDGLESVFINVFLAIIQNIVY